ncbi:MAG TPA: hypothetical protein VFZ97_07920 [Acidimicrobiales bacterium]
MTERYPPTDIPPTGVQQSQFGYRSTRSLAVERQPWSPAQLVSIILGIVFLVLGGIAIARTGVDFKRLTSEHVDVAGSTQTQLMGYLELAYGALLLAVGSIPGAGRAGMSFLGILGLVFGIIVVAQPSTFFHSLGIGSGYATFLIVIGAILMITAMVSPIYWGFTRRYGDTRGHRATTV